MVIAFKIAPSFSDVFKFITILWRNSILFRWKNHNSHCTATRMNFKFMNLKIAPNPSPKTTVTIVFRILS